MSDAHLRDAIDSVFNRYDIDHNGTLEYTEISNLLADAYKKLGKTQEVTDDAIKQFAAQADKNHDGKVSKAELYDIFKRLANKFRVN